MRRTMWMMKALLLMTATLVLVFARAELRADVDPSFSKARVSSGPLLFLSEQKRNKNALYVVDPEGVEGARQSVWEGVRSSSIRVNARLGRSLVVCSHFEKRRKQLLLLDVEKGVKLSLSTNMPAFLTAGAANVCFLERSGKRRGPRLRFSKGDDGVLRAEDAFLETQRLRISAIGAGPSVGKSSSYDINMLLANDRESFWCVADAGKPSLRVISGVHYTERDLMPFDTNWVVNATICEMSPNHDYLALSILDSRNSYNDQRLLRIIESQTGKLIWADDEVRLEGRRHTDQFGGIGPRMNLEWVGEALVRYGIDGEIVDVRRSALLPDEQVKLEDDKVVGKEKRRTVLGDFELEFGKAYFIGDDDPVANVLDDDGVQVAEMEVSVDGRWLAYSCPLSSQTFLINGRTRLIKKLSDSMSASLVWLPRDARSVAKDEDQGR